MFRLLALVALTAPAPQSMDLPFEKFTLDNGLEVVVHEDHSDPVVAVYVVYHVGSGRERPGRSGFAHLFEHMLFQGSEHVERDQHFMLVTEAGGTLNATTTFDRTLYYDVLPANELELALWLEADRMGFLLPAPDRRGLREPSRRGQERAATELREPPLPPRARDDPGGAVPRPSSLFVADDRFDGGSLRGDPSTT